MSGKVGISLFSFFSELESAFLQSCSRPPVVYVLVRRNIIGLSSDNMIQHVQVVITPSYMVVQTSLF